MVRAPDCGSGGPRFDPEQPYHSPTPSRQAGRFTVRRVGTVISQRTLSCTERVHFRLRVVLTEHPVIYRPMRYVMAIMTVTCFILWDGLRNDGQYLELGVRKAEAALRPFRR